MTEREKQNATATEKRRKPWRSPRIVRLEAGSAEVGGNPAADAPVFS
jgi:hypothetical protein